MISVTSSGFSTSTIGTSTLPGTAYSLLDGTSYTVSEPANSSYTASFSGDCNSSGQVTMNPDKTCTITNTYITPTPTPVSSGGGSGPAPATPSIGITKVANPSNLSNGGGSVTYNYTVWNVGKNTNLANVTVTDDKCGSVTLVSGDINNNYKIEPSEIWNYTCTSTISKTTTNTATATGYSDDVYHQKTTATALATVVVGGSSTVATTTPVTIATTTPLVIATTTILAAKATITPIVIPGLPNTGLAPQETNTPLNITLIIGVLTLVSGSLFLALKKRKA
jgi:hypothetical protein